MYEVPQLCIFPKWYEISLSKSVSKKVAPVDAGVGTANRSQETLYFNKTEIKIVLLSLFVKLSLTF